MTAKVIFGICSVLFSSHNTSLSITASELSNVSRPLSILQARGRIRWHNWGSELQVLTLGALYCHYTQTGLAAIIYYESAFSERSSRRVLSIGGEGWPLPPHGKDYLGIHFANRGTGKLRWK